MSLDQSIRQLAEAGTIAALEQHLPIILDRFTQPADPDERLTLEEAAAFLKMPEKTLAMRIKSGAIISFKDGTRRYILRGDAIDYNARLRAAAQFKRDQAARAAMPAGVDDDIVNLLSPAGSTPPAKKKARR